MSRSLPASCADAPLRRFRINGRFLLLLAILAACTGGGSCDSTSDIDLTYVVEITPADSGLERRITIRTQGPDSVQRRVRLRLTEEEADRLERLYGLRPDTASPDSALADTTRSGAPKTASDSVVTYVAQRRFASIPNDLGNWGMFRCYTSALGRYYMYLERIGGDPDPIGGLETSLAAADSVADLLLGWTESELGRHPGWPTLRSRIDTDMRGVIRAYALRHRRPDSKTEDTDVAAWLEHPLMQLIGAGAPPDEDAEGWVTDMWPLSEARLAVAEILGLRSQAEIDGALRFISDPDSAHRSFSRYLSAATGESTHVALGLWGSALARAASPQAEAARGDLDSLVVRLRLPVIGDDPETNGVWDEDLAYVEWSGRIPTARHRASGDPFVCYALWALPDSAAQRRLFGEVCLDEEELGAYCMWFGMLDSRRQAEWNAMLMRLRPGKIEQLERFKFSGKTAGSREIPGRDLILEAID